MRAHRVFSVEPLQTGASVRLDLNASRHLTQVLRLKAGDRLVLFDGSGNDFAAQLEQADRQSAKARVTGQLGQEPEPILQLHLAIGISRGDRMDFSIQKAVELGINRITPLFTERCVVQLKGQRLASRLEHWHGVIRHACEQSGRSRLPELHTPVALPTWLEDSPGPGVMLDHRAELPLTQLSPPQRRLSLLVGPEGGLSPTERELARCKGLASVRMGPRVLRTETAPLAALAIIQALWGDLKG